MELKNGYKLIYEAVRSDERHLYATKDTVVSEADVALTYGISEETIKASKLIYEKDGKLYASSTGIPADTDSQITVMCGSEEAFGDPDSEPDEDEE